MKNLRNKIDQVDQEIIKLLAKRKKLVLEIAEYKKQESLSIHDPKREAEILKKLEVIAKEEGLSSEYIHSLYKIILDRSREVQGE